ncbi:MULTISPECIES: Gfo/Idh/MocA family oxidoreductase [unclassified Campylobacter]|uniref:Gfo/Idh/MocA family oxidoreductase n=1 Tax=unclassified Campylobacter TaxID=2593542 RepID=UPI0022E9DACD|nr:MULTISPECIES: Gfo/Idh/MocA family oxidoreductase [unclassified Campylobacter]MDA3055693.1 Gfo/Idh/MocA family oxidoreductase [Campylobacter sp. CN_NA1]MDA3065043.1 Gfo/Idh/MocA family oxidoreductase [Campylobacter sp. CN_NE4]MDA3069200.1 Gfo/Idh/MocA family oxidoreductase [Campylobacter sp. CN_NE3]MDA3082128.1 Gfo/Idh/MocA family oxidoreductase [Campylobacter sp. CN_EL2]MDA3083763.1 Gfo/Idh/MocA family oxidoreductase [Campylobacter sp. CN_NE1]
MFSEKKKIAIIGMSELGHKHFSELRRSDFFELVGIYDEKSNENFGKVELYRDLEELFDKAKPQAVVITSSQKNHKNLILKASKYVQNILIDAPLALNLEESREIRYSLANNDTNLAIFYKNRFNATINSLLREFSKGDQIYTMNFINGKNSENSCDIMQNLLLKELDLARILCGSEISSFSSKTVTAPNSKEIIALSALGKSKNDILLTFVCSNVYPTLRHTIQISTSSGVYIADLLNFTLHKIAPSGNINLKVDNEDYCCRNGYKEFAEFCSGGMLKRLASIDESIKIREILQ